MVDGSISLNCLVAWTTATTAVVLMVAATWIGLTGGDDTVAISLVAWALFLGIVAGVATVRGFLLTTNRLVLHTSARRRRQADRELTSIR